MPVVWDEAKRLINIDKHGFDFALVESEFYFESALYTPARDAWIRRSVGSRIASAFSYFRTLGEEAISLISLRIASKKETAGYDCQS